jgi:Domain of unknown function (DUF4209)
MRTSVSDTKVFDPFIARDAADRLKRWREQAGEVAEARRAAQTAGAAFEQAAGGAAALTAIAWLSDQVQRYREIGDEAGAARVEQAIRQRAPEMKTEMTRISVPLEIKQEELAEWTDKVAGDNLKDGFAGFATIGLSRESRIADSVRELAEQAPLMSIIPVSVIGTDGFDAAKIGSVEKDIEGRTLHHAANRIGWFAPFLNVAMSKIREKHGLDLEQFMAWLSDASVFTAERLPLVREGLAAWFAEDYVKAIHVLVPQVEAAVRELLIAIGGSVMRPDRNYGGFMAAGLGDVLHDARFRTHIPTDLRFHLRVLYSDPRGINLRNEVAHGLAAPALFDRGVANWVVHTLVVLGLLRVRLIGPTPAETARQTITCAPESPT